jgi:hypothetical protein
VKSSAAVSRVKASGTAGAWCRTPVRACRVRSPIRPGCPRRSPRRWPNLTKGGQLWGEREHVFGGVASTTTLWTLVDQRINATHLPRIRGRAHARQQAWAAGAAPDRDCSLQLDVDATITVDHSDNKKTTRRPGRRRSSFTRRWCLDRRHHGWGGTDRAAAQGQRQSNTTADHISVLGQSLASTRTTRMPRRF